MFGKPQFFSHNLPSFLKVKLGYECPHVCMYVCIYVYGHLNVIASVLVVNGLFLTFAVTVVILVVVVVVMVISLKRKQRNVLQHTV